MVIHTDGHPLPLLARSLERLLSGEFDDRLREMEADLRKRQAPTNQGVDKQGE